jgi:hypothetical protein
VHTENSKYFTFSQFCNSEHTYLSDISLLVFSNVNFICSAVGRGKGQQAVIVRPVYLVSVDSIFQRLFVLHTCCVSFGYSMIHCITLVM